MHNSVDTLCKSWEKHPEYLVDYFAQFKKIVLHTIQHKEFSLFPHIRHSKKIKDLPPLSHFSPFSTPLIVIIGMYMDI